MTDTQGIAEVLYYRNCISVLNEIELLKRTRCVENFHIIALRETWLDISEKVFFIQKLKYMVSHHSIWTGKTAKEKA